MIDYQITFSNAIVVNFSDELSNIVKSYVVEISIANPDYRRARPARQFHTVRRIIDLSEPEPLNFIEFQNLTPEILIEWTERVYPGYIDEAKNILAAKYQQYLNIINPDPNISVKQFNF